MKIEYKHPSLNEFVCFSINQIIDSIYRTEIKKYEFNCDNKEEIMSLPTDVHVMKIYFNQKWHEEYIGLFYTFDMIQGFTFDIDLKREKDSVFYSTFLTITKVDNEKEGMSITIELESSMWHDLVGYSATRPTTKLITFLSGIMGGLFVE